MYMMKKMSLRLLVVVLLALLFAVAPIALAPVASAVGPASMVVFAGVCLTLAFVPIPGLRIA